MKKKITPICHSVCANRKKEGLDPEELRNIMATNPVQMLFFNTLIAGEVKKFLEVGGDS